MQGPSEQCPHPGREFTGPCPPAAKAGHPTTGAGSAQASQSQGLIQLASNPCRAGTQHSPEGLSGGKQQSDLMKAVEGVSVRARVGPTGLADPAGLPRAAELLLHLWRGRTVYLGL